MLGHCDSKSINSTVVMLGHCASKFTCGRNSRQCYTAEQRCDGVNNCNHRTDELHCCQFIALLILRRTQWRKSVFAVTCTHTHSHTHTHPFNGLFSGTTWVSRYQKGKTNLKQETVSGSGISWAICKSALRSRQITTPAPHHSVFFTGRMPFLPPNQQHQSTEGTQSTAGTNSNMHCV